MTNLLTDLQVEELQYLIKKAEKDKQTSSPCEEEWFDQMLNKLHNQKAIAVQAQKNSIETTVNLLSIEVNELKENVKTKAPISEQYKNIERIEYYCREWRKHAQGLGEEDKNGNN